MASVPVSAVRSDVLKQDQLVTRCRRARQLAAALLYDRESDACRDEPSWRERGCPRAAFDAKELPLGWSFNYDASGDMYFIMPSGETTWDDLQRAWTVFWHEYHKV